MSISNATETNILALYFNATAIANLADNAGTSPETSISVALHTADPGDTGNMSTSEATYTSYARVSVARTSGGWTVSGGTVTPAANIDFPAGTGGSGTVTHFSTGKASGGSTAPIYWSGTASPSVTTGNGVQPRLTTSTAITLD